MLSLAKKISAIKIELVQKLNTLNTQDTEARVYVYAREEKSEIHMPSLKLSAL